jgi:hypothetical protein
MKLRSLFIASGIAAFGLASCTGYFSYKALEVIEDNTQQWLTGKNTGDLKEKGLTHVFEENLSGQEAVTQLKIHGFSDDQANKFPECSRLIMDSRGLETDEKILTTKRCLKM